MTAAVVATTLNRIAMATAAFTICQFFWAMRPFTLLLSSSGHRTQRLTALSAVGHGTLYTPKRSVGVWIAPAC